MRVCLQVRAGRPVSYHRGANRGSATQPELGVPVSRAVVPRHRGSRMDRQRRLSLPDGPMTGTAGFPSLPGGDLCLYRVEPLAPTDERRKRSTASAPARVSQQGGPELPQFRDFLARFRPAGSPGAASRVGVAADRMRELSAELEPVLALLAPAHAECERIIAGAKSDAQRIMDEAREDAAVVRAQARRRADEVRTAAAEEALAAARERATTLIRDAGRRAQQPRPATDRQVSELVATAVGLVRTLPRGSGLP
jgi:cell division septum initiation protein DivIVA